MVALNNSQKWYLVLRRTLQMVIYLMALSLIQTSYRKMIVIVFFSSDSRANRFQNVSVQKCINYVHNATKFRYSCSYCTSFITYVRRKVSPAVWFPRIILSPALSESQGKTLIGYLYYSQVPARSSVSFYTLKLFRIYHV